MTKSIKTKSDKPRRLTLKQKEFAREYAKTKNGTKSALKVYDTKDPKTAQAISSENLSKPLIIEETRKLMLRAYKKAGLTEEHIAEQEAEGVNSNDLNIRHKYINTLHDVRGDKQVKEEVTHYIGGVLNQSDKELLSS